MHRIVLTLIFFYYSFSCYSNMASPIRPGTQSASVLMSSDVQIVSESIDMFVASDFKTCRYKIEYNIRTEITDLILPIAFVAIDYADDFNVLLDGEPINVINCDTCVELELPFDRILNEGKDYFYVHWSENEAQGVAMDELKYFKIPVTKKEHIITVEYEAKVWTDVSDWTKEYSFRYSLSPAETWKSFGILTIRVTTDKPIESNLGIPADRVGKVYEWSFNKLPAKYFSISYKTEPTTLSKVLLWISPEGLGCIFAALMLFLHSTWIVKSRKGRKKVRHSFENAFVSILLVILDYIFYLYTYPLIDSTIGNEASKYHGYYFLMIIFLPLLLLVHWVTIHQIDLRMRKRKAS